MDIVEPNTAGMHLGAWEGILLWTLYRDLRGVRLSAGSDTITLDLQYNSLPNEYTAHRQRR